MFSRLFMYFFFALSFLFAIWSIGRDKKKKRVKEAQCALNSTALKENYFNQNCGFIFFNCGIQ